MVYFRRYLTEKSGVISIKRGIVSKSALFTNVGCLFPRGQHLLRQKQPFFHYVLFWCLVQFLFEKSEQIGLADEKMVGYLLYPRDRTEIFTYIAQNF